MTLYICDDNHDIVAKIHGGSAEEQAKIKQNLKYMGDFTCITMDVANAWHSVLDELYIMQADFKERGTHEKQKLEMG
jgi:hypothetical protein